MQRLRVIIFMALCLSGFSAVQAKAPDKQWPAAVKEVQIKSTLDGSYQPSMVYFPKTDKPVPLLVGLHSWDGDHMQTRGIPYAKWCMKNGWAFIHPKFRGSNDKAEACGAPQVIQDIVDAVDYMKRTTKIDTKRVYMVGLSGGGYAAMLLAGKRPDLWAGVSAWVPIADLTKWHEQCVTESSSYATKMEKCLGGKPSDSKKVLSEYKQRSAITWISNAKDVPIQISAGINDDCVPVSHSISLFNRLASPKDKVKQQDIDFMVERRKIPPRLQKNIKDKTFNAKQPLFQRKSNNVELTIFKGGHEIVYQAALAWLEKSDRATASKAERKNDVK